MPFLDYLSHTMCTFFLFLLSSMMKLIGAIFHSVTCPFAKSVVVTSIREAVSLHQ